MKAADDILTLDEVSLYLKIPKSTIYMLTSKMLIPFFKVGKQLRFSKESIHMWIKEKEAGNIDASAESNPALSEQGKKRGSASTLSKPQPLGWGSRRVDRGKHKKI